MKSDSHFLNFAAEAVRRQSQILIIEDEYQLSQTLRELLESEGFSAKCAAHGGEAIQLLKTFAADLMILDFVMPVMNGGQLLTHLQNAGSKTPVILMSEFPHSSKLVASFAISFLPKPFTVEQLFERVKMALNVSIPNN